MMQQVSELVKDGLYFAMGQHGGFAAHRRCEVAADQAQVWSEPVWRGPARDEAVHPGAAPLVFARIPVGVEPPQEFAVLIANVVVEHLRIPDRHAGLFRHLNTVEAVHQVEEAGHHALGGEVGTQRLLIEIIERRPLFFGIIGDVPRLQFRRSGAFNLPVTFDESRGVMVVFATAT